MKHNRNTSAYLILTFVTLTGKGLYNTYFAKHLI